jgi:FtsP/CotA-like multicopper oxidase with cupredoxin domain
LIQSFDDGNHPFHLHGYKFFVLAQGHGYAPADLQDTVDLSNPLRRDTASVEAFGWLLIRFVADNPGVWAFHCHLGWHNEAGLGMVFATRVDEMVRWKEEGGMRDVRALCDG